MLVRLLLHLVQQNNWPASLPRYTRKMKSAEIRQKYDETAHGYDWKIALLERVSGAHRLREKLLKKARGKVLDVACGTGRNFSYFPKDCQVTGIDLSPAMLELARKKAENLSLDVQLIAQDVEQLDFSSQSFDTVVSSLAVCTYPHPIEAIKEMTRVCKKGGRLLLLEHGRSDWSLLAHVQDVCADRFAKHSGCTINREPLALAQAAGIKILSHRKSCAGVLHIIEAEPRK